MADNVLEKIKAEYLEGGVSQRELAEKYGISQSAIKRIASKEKWSSLRAKTQEKANQKITSAISRKQARRAERVTKVADKLLDKLEKIVDELSANDILLDRYAVKQITGGLKDYAAIVGIKSELDVKEQQARIEKLKKDAKEEKTDYLINVVIGSDAEEYGK